MSPEEVQAAAAEVLAEVRERWRGEPLSSEMLLAVAADARRLFEERGVRVIAIRAHEVEPEPWDGWTVSIDVSLSPEAVSVIGSGVVRDG